ncbi:MAG TPA: molybdate ABC transporter permease subunit [Candidatus Binataceae bacterium]|nr:molybdate ABC transporter permease subunit [Candidatus Binataceae bacterium]
MDWQPIILTIRIALTVCAILLVIGMPVAYWLAFTNRRWKFLAEALSAMPIVLPPTVLGFYILVAIGPQSPVGRLYQEWVGRGLPFSFEGLVLASVIYSFPFMVQPMATAFAAVDRNLISASSILGASRMKTFLRIILPLSMGGIVTGIVLSFAHTLGEFGVVLMVGGNIPGATQTIAIAIYDDVQALDYKSANETALLLLAFSFITLSITYALNRRVSTVPRLRI